VQVQAAQAGLIASLGSDQIFKSVEEAVQAMRHISENLSFPEGARKD
jgi:hypothetical protein